MLHGRKYTKIFPGPIDSQMTDKVETLFWCDHVFDCLHGVYWSLSLCYRGCTHFTRATRRKEHFRETFLFR